MQRKAKVLGGMSLHYVNVGYLKTDKASWLHCKGNQVWTSQLLCLLHEGILQADEITEILPAKGKHWR